MNVEQSRDATRANRMTLQARRRIEEESRAGYITRHDINRRALYIHVVLGGQRICLMVVRLAVDKRGTAASVVSEEAREGEQTRRGAGHR